MSENRRKDEHSHASDEWRYAAVSVPKRFWIDRHRSGRWVSYSVRLPYFAWIRIGRLRFDVSWRKR